MLLADKLPGYWHLAELIGKDRSRTAEAEVLLRRSLSSSERLRRNSS